MSDMRVYSGQETPSADIEMQDIKMEAEIIVEPHVPNALRRARRAQILFEWWPGGESNSRHADFQSATLDCPWVTI